MQLTGIISLYENTRSHDQPPRRLKLGIVMEFESWLVYSESRSRKCVHILVRHADNRATDRHFVCFPQKMRFIRSQLGESKDNILSQMLNGEKKHLFWMGFNVRDSPLAIIIYEAQISINFLKWKSKSSFRSSWTTMTFSKYHNRLCTFSHVSNEALRSASIGTYGWISHFEPCACRPQAISLRTYT